jgi:TonB family protein
MWMITLLMAVAVPAQAARTDGEVWALAVAANHPWAYRSYARRFPAGEHAAEARRKYEEMWREELRRAGVSRSGTRTAEDVEIDKLCVASLLANEQNEEMNAYRAARDAPGVTAYKRFIINFPQARCRGNAELSLADRMHKEALIAPIAGFGPVAARIEPFTVSTFDYPYAALLAKKQGRVVVQAELTEEGRADNCQVLVSAGPLLDDGTCSFVRTRVRGEAARDAAGKPYRTTFQLPIVWQIANRKIPK